MVSTENSLKSEKNGVMGKRRNARDQVIERASRLFERKGFRATSIGEITAASGIKRGGLYHHFQDKDHLALEVLDQAAAGFADFLDRALAGTTPRSALTHFYNAVLTKHKKAGFVGGCIFGNTALEMADDGKPYASAIAQTFDMWIRKIESVVRRAQERGEVRDDLSARVLASHVVMAIEGGIMLARLNKNEAPLKECLRSLRKMLFVKNR
jgi:TetR/AcrR family transcriptional regulator, transcriptional repressor for nem operon